MTTTQKGVDDEIEHHFMEDVSFITECLLSVVSMQNFKILKLIYVGFL